MEGAVEILVRTYWGSRTGPSAVRTWVSHRSLLNVEPDFEGGRHSRRVAEIASMKICVYLFHRYFLSIYYMPDTILDMGYRRIEQICTQMPHRLSCLACEWTNFDPSKCNVKFSSFTSFWKNPFLPNIR